VNSRMKYMFKCKSDDVVNVRRINWLKEILSK